MMQPEKHNDTKESSRNNIQVLPLTVRRSIELVGLFVLGSLIMLGSSIITPLVLAFFLSIVLLPVHRFLRRRKIPEILSITIVVMLLFIAIAGIIWFFSAQISRLLVDLPRIKENVMVHLHSISEWINKKTNFSTARQLQLINDQSNKLLNYAGSMLGGAAASLSAIFIFVGLLPIYIFLMLFYKNLLVRFIFLWFPDDNHPKVQEVLRETEVIIKSYLVGLLIQITYLTVMLGGILLIIGIKHAILIGVIFAILNLIPYIGALVGNLIAVLLTLTSSQEVWPIFAVLITIAAVQFVDNNILMPRIVGSKVKINALASIVGVIVAGSLAGVAGMFLSLPVIAVFKIIFDRTGILKQWGVLLGDEKPRHSQMNFPLLRMKSKKVQKKFEAGDDMQPTNM